MSSPISGPPKKTHEFRFAQPHLPSTIRLGGQHHLANELTFAALRGVSWMPSCAGSMTPFLGHGIENLWYLLMATRNPAFHSPVDNMVCISRIIYNGFAYMSGGCSISSINSMSPLKLGRHWLKDGENGIQIWVGTPPKRRNGWAPRHQKTSNNNRIGWEFGWFFSFFPLEQCPKKVIAR